MQWDLKVQVLHIGNGALYRLERTNGQICSGVISSFNEMLV